MKKLLSIIMPVYNHARYLNESIQSVISQTYKNWELIIIDDGSIDNSIEIAKKYTAILPDQIKLFTHQNGKNLGIAASYLLGLSLCKGEFIGFIEPDDIWTTANAEIKINLLLNNDIGLVYSNVEPIGIPEIIAMRKLVLKSFLKAPVNAPFKAFSRLLVINFIPPFSAVIAKKELLQHLKFDINKEYGIWLDWFVWLQASLRGKFLFIPRKLVKWRLYNNSYCTKFVLKKRTVNMIIFELKYRYLLFKELILLHRIGAWKKLGILYFFILGFIERTLIFIYREYINNYSNRRRHKAAAKNRQV